MKETAGRETEAKLLVWTCLGSLWEAREVEFEDVLAGG